MKMTDDRPYADPEKAARRLMEHARAFEPVQDGRVYIEKINALFLFGDKATAAEHHAGLAYAIEHGWIRKSLVHQWMNTYLLNSSFSIRAVSCRF